MPSHKLPFSYLAQSALEEQQSFPVHGSLMQVPLLQPFEQICVDDVYVHVLALQVLAPE